MRQNGMLRLTRPIRLFRPASGVRSHRPRGRTRPAWVRRGPQGSVRSAASTSRSAVTCVLAAIVAGGCAKPIPPDPDARPVDLGAFAAARPEGAGVASGSPEAAAAERPGDRPDGAASAPLPLGAADERWLEAEQSGWSAPADADAGPSLVPGQPLIVDSMVGQVNGRPIFADDFLEPIEDRLLRAAEQYSGVQLEIMYRSIINEWLRDVVLNELILAEAEASLTQQQKQGLLSWLEQLYDEEIRLGGGTKAGAEERRRASGEELDQYLGKQKDFILIEEIKRTRIQPRVIVSWRDIEREYQRRWDEFNPPATVTFARIRVRTGSDAELIEQVTRRLEAGDPFTAIAADLGVPDDGVWQTFQMGPGGITDIEVSEPMKEALAGLGEGDTTEALQLGTTTVWLNVYELHRPQTYSIYDPQVQLMLTNAVRSARNYEEWNRFINSLLESGIHDDLDGMAERLLRIAMTRYAP